MGLLTWPFDGLLLVFREVADQAERMFYDEDAIAEQLAALHRRLEAGGLDEADFAAQEEALAARLAEAGRRRRRRK